MFNCPFGSSLYTFLSICLSFAPPLLALTALSLDHIQIVCLAGVVALYNVADLARCNPKVPSSTPPGGKDCLITSVSRGGGGGAHKSTGPLCAYSVLKCDK